MAHAVTRVSGLETMPVIGGLMEGFAASRICTVIAEVWIIGVVHVAIKSMRTVEPGACADKDAAVEPFRTVVAIRSAIVRRVIVVSVRAGRRDADTDRNLRVRCRSCSSACQEESRNSEKCIFKSTHNIEPFNLS